jgi:signal transduction histidine kinase
MLGQTSTKELLLWIGGMVTVAVIVVLALTIAVDFSDPRDPDDPLLKQGGVKAVTQKK